MGQINNDFVYGIVGASLVAISLIVMGGIAVWLAGRAFEHRSAERRVQAITAFNQVASATTRLSRYNSVREVLGVILRESLSGLEADSGAVFLSDATPAHFRLVYSIHVADFAGVTTTLNEAQMLARLRGSPQQLISGRLSALPEWRSLRPHADTFLVVTLFGAEHGWQGVIMIAWESNRHDRELAEGVLNIARYANSVLNEMEARYQRARDVTTFSASLDDQDSLMRRVRAAVHDVQQPIMVLMSAFRDAGTGEDLTTPITLSPQHVKHLRTLADVIGVTLHQEFGDDRLRLESVLLTDLLDVAAVLLSPDHNAVVALKQLKFSIDADLALPPLRVERVGLIRVLSNLLNNAAKYCNDGGAITLRVGRQKSSALFVIENSGETIAPEDLLHLFDYGFRTEAAKKSSAAGRGIGLYVSQQIIQKHGGEIMVESRNRLTHFSFAVPLDLSEEQSS